MKRTKTDPNTLYLAEFESRHYTWRTVGRTREEALKLMEKTLKKGGTEWTAAKIREIVHNGDTSVTKLTAGMGLRDETEIL